MDTTIKKVSSAHSPQGDDGETYLVSGIGLAMRLWKRKAPTKKKETHRNPYETVGFVISGKAKLHVGEQMVTLEKGDSWLVPKDVDHRYEILETFTAVEATAPPAHLHGRDD